MDADLQLEMGRCSNMWEMYQDFWRPFGELLTDMEKKGMMVNRWVDSFAVCARGVRACPAC